MSRKVTCWALCTDACMLARWQWRQRVQFCGGSCFSTGKRLSEGEFSKHATFGLWEEEVPTPRPKFQAQAESVLDLSSPTYSPWTISWLPFVPWWLPKLNIHLIPLSWGPVLAHVAKLLDVSWASQTVLLAIFKLSTAKGAILLHNSCSKPLEYKTLVPDLHGFAFL